MRKVFEVELASENGGTELTLPATPYALLDALQKLDLADGEAPRWEILRIPSCGHLSPYLDHGGTLPELNALTQRLSELDESELHIMEGLIRMEQPRPGITPVPLSRLIDMAYSTDCCHLVEGVVTDVQLGRFCAENGFVPEAEGLSDKAFELLDFTRIGREFRQNEGGAFTRGGYVQRHDELKQVYQTLDITIKKPDYAILAELEVDGELLKYKAVLEATHCEDICRALSLADELDQYTFDPDLLEPDEVAGVKLDQLLGDDMVKLLLPHVQLCAFGSALIQASGGKLTAYGLVERTDVQPVQDIVREQTQAEGMSFA